MSKYWKVLNSSYPFSTSWLKLRQDKILTHLGEKIKYTYCEHPGSVGIVALTEKQEVVLIKQYRHSIRKSCYEIPAGRMNHDKTLLNTAKLELLEETGAYGGIWQQIGSFYPSNGTSNENFTFFLARAVIIGENRLERTELIETILMPWDECIIFAKMGKIKDAPSALALLLTESYIKDSTYAFKNLIN